jgi:uncharacterized protein (TIGR02996 family)
MMEAEQKQFLAYIANQPWNDELPRNIYADWLDEHDQPDEANRQRKYVSAERWLRTFADGIYASYQSILDAAAARYNKGASTLVGDNLGFDAQNSYITNDNSIKFWECWSVIAGVKLKDGFIERIIADEGLTENPFSCCY